MEKIIKFSIIFLVLGSIFISGCIDSEKPSEIGGLSKSTNSFEDPNNFGTYIIQDEEGKFHVPIDVLSNGYAYFSYPAYQYKVKDFWIPISPNGMYKGGSTQRWEDDGEYHIYMAVVPEKIDPNDGIVHGAIFESLEGVQPVIYVYADEDFKKAVNGNLNIFWGAEFENKRSFEWNEIAKGVYLDIVAEDDYSRFSSDYSHRKGGVVVGDMPAKEADGEWTGMKLN